MKIKDSFSLAVKNVASHGDTDIFPYPIDNALFNDFAKEIVVVLEEIEKEKDLNRSFLKYPLVSETLLVASGYTGYRAATQIDPLWNAYFLGVIVDIGKQIEESRFPVERNNIFSYRFQPDKNNGGLFRKIGWREFQLESVKRAEEYEYVVACDISDFYSRIYHHRLENVLQRVAEGSHLISCVMSILKELSRGTSYGLPIGGPAARLLSELLLVVTDKLLETTGISFVRFADDYHIFAKTKQDAYRHLIYLSEKLQKNEGLSLQKAKTRIMTSKEFLATSEFSNENQSTTPEERTLQRFRSLRLHYDPYSMTAPDDYKTLKEALKEFDITEMLQAELNKSRIHQPTTKKLLSAIKHLDSEIKIAAVKTILENMEILSPVFPNVIVLLKDVVQQQDEAVNKSIFDAIHLLFENNSPLISLPINIAYCLRVLAFDRAIETDRLITSIYNKTESLILRRDVINVMTHKGADYWLSDKLRTYGTAAPWEKRALLIASYVLTDEGSHWRKSVKSTLSEYDKIIMKWIQDRKQSGKKGLPI